MTHAELVAKTVKPAVEIITTITPKNLHLLHMAIGIAGEVGELLDAVVNNAAVLHMKEEIGDIEWYLEGYRAESGVRPLEGYANSFPKTKPLEACLGLSIHAARLLDLSKKVAVYNKCFDPSSARDLVNAIDHYLYVFRATLGITREECIEMNIVKLLRRYPNAAYTDADAQARKDKQE